MGKHRKWPTGEGKQIYKKQMNVIKHRGSNTLNFWEGLCTSLPLFLSYLILHSSFIYTKESMQFSSDLRSVIACESLDRNQILYSISTVA